MEYVEHRMNDEAAKAVASAGLVSPLNILLVSIILYTAYTTFFSKSAPSQLPRQPPPIVFKTYNPHTLLPFNGANNGPVYMAIRGVVFDVSRGRNFYGPGGPYENFAGRDASRGLACGSFDEDMLTKDLDGPLDTLADLGAEEMDALKGWEERFTEKYDIIGKFVSMKEFEALSGKE
ncbi:cytochrome b5-like heme/steroid binding domain-containing protein [Trichoderma sp. SZMC 28014]